MGLDTVGLDTVGLDTAGLDNVGLDNVGLCTEGLNAVGLDAVGLNAVGLDAVGLNAVGLDAVGLDIVGLDAVALLDIGYLNTVPGKVLIYCPGHVDLSSLSLTSDTCGGHLGNCWGHFAQDGHHVVGVLAGEEAIVYVCGEHDAYPFPRGDVVALAPLLFCLYLLPEVFPLLVGPGAGLDAWRQ